MQSVSGANDGGTVTVDYDVAQGLTTVNLGFGFGHPNVLRLHGVTPGDIDLERVGDGSLYFFIQGQSFFYIGSKSAGTGLIWHDFSDADDLPSQIVFDDGTVWDKPEIEQQFVDQEEAGNPSVITGFSGDETIECSTGDTLLIGGSGSDTYIYRSGDGYDRIDDRNLPDFQGVYGSDKVVFADLNFDQAQPAARRRQ